MGGRFGVHPFLIEGLVGGARIQKILRILSCQSFLKILNIPRLLKWTFA